jgi:hypothetical protein
MVCYIVCGALKKKQTGLGATYLEPIWMPLTIVCRTYRGVYFPLKDKTQQNKETCLKEKGWEEKLPFGFRLYQVEQVDEQRDEHDGERAQQLD